MKKLKKWLIDTFLPAWAKVQLLEELRKKEKEIQELKDENEWLRAYIDGLQWGIRSQRRIVINTGEVKK